MKLCALVVLAASATAFAPAIAHAEDAPANAPAEKVVDPKVWGDASAALVERFGHLGVDGAEVGKSGLVRGSGLEVRFAMPMEWGAYYRYVTSATKNGDRAEWSHKEFSFGVSRRLVHVGRRDLWSPRASARIDVGLGYVSFGTNTTCSGGFGFYSVSCQTPNGQPVNATGDAFALEARVGGDLSYGVLFVGADVGIAGYWRFVTGGNSVSPPALSYMPSGQLRIGVGFPFS
jgi:hypothetical protein